MCSIVWSRRDLVVPPRPRLALRPLTCVLAVVSLLSPCLSSNAADLPRSVKRILLMSQAPDGHPKTTHEYDAGARLLESLLQRHEGCQVTRVRADGDWPEGPELLRQFDVAVMFLSEGAKWTQADPRRRQALAEMAARGGGFVLIHWAMGTKSAEPIAGFLKIAGGCHGGPDRKHKVMQTQLSFAEHEICRGLKPLPVREEFYYQLKFAEQGQLSHLAFAQVDQQQQAVAWAWERPDGGRSFGFSGLHFHDNWKHEVYRRLVVQGILWTSRLPIPIGGAEVGVRPEQLRLETPSVPQS